MWERWKGLVYCVIYILFYYFIKLYLGNNKLGMLLMRIRSEYLKAVDSKSSLQTNHTSTSYPNSHPTSPLKSASNHDVLEFFDKDKAYFEFTPYSSHSLFPTACSPPSVGLTGPVGVISGSISCKCICDFPFFFI